MDTMAKFHICFITQPATILQNPILSFQWRWFFLLLVVIPLSALLKLITITAYSELNLYSVQTFASAEYGFAITVASLYGDLSAPFSERTR